MQRVSIFQVSTNLITCALLHQEFWAQECNGMRGCGHTEGSRESQRNEPISGSACRPAAPAIQGSWKCSAVFQAHQRFFHPSSRQSTLQMNK